MEFFCSSVVIANGATIREETAELSPLEMEPRHMEKRAAPVSFSLLVHSLHSTIKLGIINLITYFRKQLKEEKTVEKLLDIM